MNLDLLNEKLISLQEKWEQVAFGSEFKGEMKFEVMATIEEEIYLTKLEIKKRIKGVS